MQKSIPLEVHIFLKTGVFYELNLADPLMKGVHGEVIRTAILTSRVLIYRNLLTEDQLFSTLSKWILKDCLSKVLG